MNIRKNINNINRNGFTIVAKVFTKKQCDDYIAKCEEVLQFLLKKKKVNTISTNAQAIDNPFQYDDFFFKQVYFKKIDKLLKELLDDNYVLINSNLKKKLWKLIWFLKFPKVYLHSNFKT